MLPYVAYKEAVALEQQAQQAQHAAPGVQADADKGDGAGQAGPAAAAEPQA